MKLYHPSPEPARWDTKLCFNAVSMIAEVHSRFWNDTDSLVSFDWISHKNYVTSTELAQAAGAANALVVGP